MNDPRLKIDLNSLDDELLKNSSLVQEVCDEAALAVSIRATKKDALKTMEALLDAEYRDKLKSTKITEKIIESAVQTDARRQQAFNEWNAADLAAAKASSLVDAVTTRSSDLKELSKLYISGYFAIDSTRRSAVTQQAEYAKMRLHQAEMREHNNERQKR